MKNGWIRIYRKITDNPLYFSEKFTRMQAWFDLLILANHDEGYIYVRGNKVCVKRGQIGMSNENIGRRWRWSRGKVTRFLNELENEGMLIQQKNNITTLISICNYDTYQGGSTADEHQTAQQIKQQTEQQTCNRQYTNKNDKNDKKYNNIYTETEIISIFSFEEFWNMYDRKVGKPKAEKLYAQISEKDRAKIKEYVPQYVLATPDKTFRKHPQTFLRNKGWEDEIINRNYGHKQSSQSDKDRQRKEWLAREVGEAFSE